MKPKLTKEDFDKLLISYIRQMSKQCALPREVERKLLREVTRKRPA